MTNTQLESRQCAYCLNQFQPAFEREACCTDECKVFRKKAQQAAYRRRHKKNLPVANCIECGAAFQPRTKTQITCGNDCRAERARARALAYQRRMRASMDRVDLAQAMTESAIGPVLMADTIEELEMTSEMSLNLFAGSMKRLVAAKKALILKDNFEKAANGVEEAIDNVLLAAAKADAKAQGASA